MKPPRYGQLKTTAPDGVKWGDIWRSREDELEPVELLEEVLFSEDRIKNTDIEDGRDAWKMASEILPQRLFRVLHMRYMQGMTFEEIGECFNVTRERIRQIELKALRNLRKFALDAGLKPPLSRWEVCEIGTPMHAYDAMEKERTEKQ